MGCGSERSVTRQDGEGDEEGNRGRNGPGTHRARETAQEQQDPCELCRETQVLVRGVGQGRASCGNLDHATAPQHQGCMEASSTTTGQQATAGPPRK